MESPHTNLAEVIQRRIELSRAYRERFERGDYEALREILDISPESLREPWVRNAVLTVMRSGKFPPRATRGRTRGATPLSRAVGLGVVYYVNDQVSNHGKTVERALQELAEGGFENLSYERLKQLYYRTRHDPRLQALLFAGPAF